MKFAEGDKITVTKYNGDGGPKVGSKGVVVEFVAPRSDGTGAGPYVLATFENFAGHGPTGNQWFLACTDVKRTTTSPRQPSVADDLKLTPQAKTVLSHLKRRDHISNAEAERVYGITRLAACIYEIRKIGYLVKSVFKHDDAGHKYTKYVLVKTKVGNGL